LKHDKQQWIENKEIELDRLKKDKKEKETEKNSKNKKLSNQ